MPLPMLTQVFKRESEARCVPNMTLDTDVIMLLKATLTWR